MQSRKKSPFIFVIIGAVAVAGLSYLFFQSKDDHLAFTKYGQYQSVGAGNTVAPIRDLAGGKAKGQASDSTANVKDADDAGSGVRKHKRVQARLAQTVQTERVRVGSEMATGPLLEVADSSYRLVDIVYAIPKSEYHDQYDMIAEKNGYILVKYNGERPDGAWNVVRNEETGNLAIFTGVISVKYHDGQNVEALVSELMSQIDPDSQYFIKERKDYIHLIFYQFEEFETVMAIKKELENESHTNVVRRVKIELLEYARSNR